MESSKRKSQIIVLSFSIFVLFTCIIWYARIDVKDQYKHREEVDIDFDSAVKRFGEDDALSYKFMDVREVAYTKSRTMIPLVFKRDTIYKQPWKSVMIAKNK